MTISIRFGEVDDFQLIITGDPHVPAHILNWKLRNREIIIAAWGAEIIGYLRLEYLWSKYPYIGLIKVHSDFRGQGVGKGLLEYAQVYLSTQGIKAIYSSSQVNENDPQQWHRKMGFKECGILNGINEGNIGELFFVKEF
ncbi:GNAT family N-acetyltransferase [Cohnella cholangitidis]|uniref:GNAT family N-acetyltransferase n=1 Tax=Cohnella cholangitidis TaxID=2598458 RepID=A0A7G5BSU4_9BACL|nr:GNAT family N-acetyltransferase [Cohnella cholangitidis]QMV40028.1 GNAT family N-acetyltransferase [Cohnella cholangitidis]